MVKTLGSGKVAVKVVGSNLTLKATGELDFCNGHLIKEVFDEHYKKTMKQVTFDFSTLEFIDAHTLGIFVNCLRGANNTEEIRVLVRSYLPHKIFKIVRVKLEGEFPNLKIYKAIPAEASPN